MKCKVSLAFIILSFVVYRALIGGEMCGVSLRDLGNVDFSSEDD